jgi:hypothetical protein
MLHSIQLENFKAFGQRTIIPLAPITLIFGQNSAGKSSILQALNLLKQTRESRDVEALLLPRTESGFADLGSFQEMLFDHDLERVLSIRLDTAWDGMAKKDILPRFLPDSGSIALEMNFARKSIKEEISLNNLTVFHQGDNSALARFEPAVLTRGMRMFGGMHFVPRTLRQFAPNRFRAAKCVAVTDVQDHWKHSFLTCKRQRTKCLTALQDLKTRFQSGKEKALIRHLFLEEDEEDNRTAITNRIQDATEFFSSDFTIERYMEKMRAEELDTLIGLDGFLPSQEVRIEQRTSFITLLDRYGDLRGDLSLDVTRFATLAGAAVRQLLTMLFPLGPFRKPPERYYIFTGATPQDVGYQGHLLPDLLFRHPELVRETNEWLERLDIGYSLRIRPLGRKEKDLFEVRLVDMRRKPNVEVGLTDVGFGISQILPLVVQSLAGADQIISVEQPEVHIHPRLQADLGDLLIEAIKEPRRNQFIIETHSEHLALRLQRRVRERTLSPDDVSVVYVSRGPNGATVQPLRLDEEGDFMDDFPGGFFPERLRELR